MSDAGLFAVVGKTEYTLSSYMKYYRGIITKVNQLNADKQSTHKWIPRDVELVLHIIHSKYDLKIH